MSAATWRTRGRHLWRNHVVSAASTAGRGLHAPTAASCISKPARSATAASSWTGPASSYSGNEDASHVVVLEKEVFDCVRNASVLYMSLIYCTKTKCCRVCLNILKYCIKEFTFNKAFDFFYSVRTNSSCSRMYFFLHFFYELWAYLGDRCGQKCFNFFILGDNWGSASG